MHLIIHTQYYPPEVGAPQTRLNELACELVQRGFRVTVLTAMPNYPTGKIHTGYRGLWRHEQLDGVQVVRTAIYPSQKASLLPRLTSYFSFVLSSLLIGGWMIGRADYLLTESPPLFLGIAGFLLSRWKRARWVFNVSDLWPESAVRLGLIHEGYALRISQALEAFFYRKAWVVTGQSSSILNDIRQRFPLVNTFHFSNGADTRRFRPDLCNHQDRKLLSGDEQKIIILYAGLHGLAQGLDQALDAARQLQDLPGACMVFLGDGPEKQALIKKAEALGLENVRFIDPVPQHRMPGLIASSDVCLIPLKMYIPGAVPSKLYEAMSSARPVLVIAEGEPAEIVSHHQAGLVVKPGNIEGIADAIRRLATHPELRQTMGEAGRKTAINCFDRSKIIEDLVVFINSQ